MENQEEFVLAYAALCKKHQLCIVPESPHDGGLYVAEYGDGDWVEDVVLCEGREVYEAYQKQVKDGH